MLPEAAPYFPLPTISNFRVRDLSVTDFKGSYLVIFLFSSDFENTEDLQDLNKNVKKLKKHCELLGCSTDSTMLHSQWLKSFPGDFQIPLISDKNGVLGKKFDLFDEDEGVNIKSFLLIDDKSVCREILISSLSIDEIISNLIDLIKYFKNAKTEDVGSKEFGSLDRIWRTTLKMSESPRRSMVRGARSVSRTKSPTESGSKRSQSTLGRRIKDSIRSGKKEIRGTADDIAESIIKSVKMCMSSFYSEAELQSLSTGEIKLTRGKVNGLWKLCRGGFAQMNCVDKEACLTFPIMLRGMSCSYDFSGRRLKGEVSCCYEKVLFRVQLSQKVTPECFSEPIKLRNISLLDVKGVRMNVTGFGPLNWIAGKSVTNIIQETVIQKAEDYLKGGVLLAINNGTFYFEWKEAESFELCPAGILVS